MKITVLNGSPKGDKSVTMQYINYIQKTFPEHELNIINIAQKINKIKLNETYFKEIINEIEQSNAVIWAFPLYVFLVSYQYKRFIELITEYDVKESFKDKYTAVLSTSIHFYDHTAHNYMNAICDDLEMKFLGSYSADMDDLFQEKERENLCKFAKNFFEDVKLGATYSKNYWPLEKHEFKYHPSFTNEKIDKENKNVVLITDSTKEDSNLSAMVERFEKSFQDGIEVYNLNDVDIKGGCLGCLKCGYNNICTYHEKDGFMDFYNKLNDFDAIIFAGSITDRYLSSKWKQFFDRGFFNTHIPVFKDKQLGFIISGSLSQNSNLREILEGYAQWQHANIVDFITDEYKDSEEIDRQIQNFAKQTIRLAASDYLKPSTFLGVGGMLIFRDAIYGRLRFPFQADYKYYKKNGYFNFPQKNYKTRVTNMAMGLLIKIPPIRKEIYQNKIKNEMIKPFQNI
jgi:multimeric flavodoxin WrbA